jgi:Na+/phosphate symporter
VLGANIGTCVTAILSALGRPQQAVQAAFVHVVFNVLGVLVWLPFVPELAAFVREMSPVDTARQIANAHNFASLGQVLANQSDLPFFGVDCYRIDRSCLVVRGCRGPDRRCRAEAGTAWAVQ